MVKTSGTLLIRFIILGLLIIHLQSQVIDCTKANSSFCGTGYCADYSFTNNQCVQQLITCTSTQFFSNSSNLCVDCLTQSSSTCTPNCLSFSYFTNAPTNYVQGTSTINGCNSCEDAFGLGCASCSNSNCITCKSLMTLNSSTNNCRGSNCTSLSNCIVCGSSTVCQLCLQGFQLNSTDLKCITASCKIKYCVKCNGALCSTCYQGYKLSIGADKCQPSCSDPQCNNCVSPGICGGCKTGYILNSQSSTCSLNCSSNSVSNCFSCSHENICDVCLPGYHVTFKGTKCSIDCSDGNCIVCSSSSVCTICNKGYKISGSSCIQDSCFVDYCNNCLTITQCQECVNIFTYDNINKICKPSCLQNTANCLICANSSYCQSCYVGYKIRAVNQIEGNSTITVRTCQKICNLPNCQTCGSSLTCLACADNYALSADYKTCKLQCIPNCDICQSSTTCRTCLSGFDPLNNGATCAQKCQSGQVYASNTCQSCDLNRPNCLSCRIVDLAVQCQSCSDGYYLDDSFNCKLCSTLLSNCLRCQRTVSVSCLQCLSPAKLTSGTCVSCIILNCQNCQISDSSKCANCSTGFQLASDGKCNLKSITCPTKTILINGECTCSTGTYMINAACQLCPTNCISCRSHLCTKCQESFYADGQSCKLCGADCSSCTSATMCTQCKNDRSLSEGVCISTGGQSSIKSNSGQIISCGTGCKSCTLSAESLVICTVPEDGYSIIKGVPQKCDSSCKSCSTGNSQHCRSCFDGRALEGQSCLPCLGSNTLTCSQTNRNFSLTCQKGYTTRTSPGICKKCIANCKKCDLSVQGRCDSGSCSIGYLLDETNLCVNCLNNCPICLLADPAFCTACETNKYLVNGACISCKQNCQSCTNEITCTSCIHEYVIANITINGLKTSYCYKSPEYPCSTWKDGTSNICGKCFIGFTLTNNTGNTNTSCVFNSDCNSTKTCTSCDNNLYLSDGQCLSCSPPTGCMKCKGNNICTKCTVGYYLSDKSCTRCQTGCKRCRNSDYCHQSDGGYFISINHDGSLTGIVKPCESPCGTCQKQAYYCLTCVSGFSISGAKCFSDKAIKVKATFASSLQGTSTDSKQAKLRKVYSRLHQFKKIICLIIPQIFRINDDDICSRTLVILSISIGSVNVEFKVDTNKQLSQQEAKNAVINSITEKGIDGDKSTQLVAAAQGYTTSVASLNLALVLGVSIPLGLLFILIIVVVYYSRKSEDLEQDQYDYEKDQNQDDEEAI